MVRPLSIAALAAYTVLFFGPLQVYLGNAAEYSVTLALFAAMHFVLATVVAVGLALLLRKLPEGARRRVLPVVFGMALMLYVQGNFFVWDYGLLDGREIVWADHFGVGLMEVLAWVAAFALCARFGARLLPWVAPVSLALLAIQAGAVAISSLHHRALPHQLFQVDGRGLETFAAEDNVVLIVVDGFQASAFEEILRDDRSFAETARGFTWFRNAVAGYSKTLGSVPNLLTGSFNLNEKPLADYFEKAFDGSLMRLLRESGYRVEVYPWIDKTLLFSPAQADNIIPRQNFGGALRLLPYSVDLALFRHVPHFLKPLVYRDQKWLLSGQAAGPAAAYDDLRRLSRAGGIRDIDFLQRMSGLRVAGNGRRVFKYIHLQGPHAPFLRDENLNFGKLPYDAAGYLAQARASLKILRAFLQGLQDKGLYDAATVVIVSDHGGGEYRVPFPDRAAPGQGRPGVSAGVIAAGLPLVLVKPAGRRGPLRVSDAPVAGGDVARTVAGLLGIDNDLPGRSMFAIGENQARERLHYHYSFDGWDRAYLPRLTEYRVSGDSWDSRSWQATGRVLEPPETRREEAPAPAGERPQLGIGARYRFGFTGEADAMLAEGWAKPAARWVWPAGQRASMTFGVDGPARDLRVIFTLEPTARGGLAPLQHATVRSGGRVLANWKVSGRQRFAVAVPAALVRAGRVSLAFELPDTVAARAPAVRPETALAFRDIEVERANPLPRDLVIRTVAGGNLAPFAGSGWSWSGTDQTWGLGAETSVIFAFPTQAAPGSNYRLTADCMPLLFPAVIDSNPITVLLNGRVVATWDLTGAGTPEALLTVPPSGLATVTFRAASWAIPAEFKPDSRDPRPLSILFREISLRPESVQGRASR